MAIKIYKPTTPTRRFATSVSRDDITKQSPEKSLVESKKRSGGRNSTGRVLQVAGIDQVVPVYPTLHAAFQELLLETVA